MDTRQSMNAAPAVAIIPARYDSTRFPGKPLADRTGQPLIVHVIQQVRQAKRVSRVLVATDDQRIFDAVQSFGGVAVMTNQDHPNGTSRIAEVARSLDPPFTKPSSIIVNVQGDEPEIEPSVIDELVEGLASESIQGGAPMATLVSEFAPDEDPADPNVVKVVSTQLTDSFALPRALYFSRSLIPFDRDQAHAVRPLKHPGLYAYRRDFLLRYTQLPPTPLEQSEQLEQLRALEHGYPIALVKTVVRHHGIDTPQQYDAFVNRYLHSRYG